MDTFTHVGSNSEFGYAHRTSRGIKHGKEYSGKFHALNGAGFIYSGAKYQSLCGEEVVAQFSEELDGFSIWEAKESTKGVTCKRCQKILGKNTCK